MIFVKRMKVLLLIAALLALPSCRPSDPLVAIEVTKLAVGVAVAKLDLKKVIKKLGRGS